MRTVKDEGVTILGTVGDVNPIEYGGGFIIQEGEAVRIEYFHGLESDYEGEPDPEEIFNVFYACVHRDVFAWHTWVSLDEQERLAEAAGVSIEEYRLQARSEDPVKRARIIEDIAGIWGWDELDPYPAQFTERELRERWDCED